MAAISALMVNDNVMRREPYDDEHTPTTPRAVSRMLSPARGLQDASEAHTYETKASPKEPSLQRTTPSVQLEPQDSKNNPVDDDSDAMDLDPNQDDQDGSDNDTEQGESGTASRKKKGQRFFCTGYPPCNLSFTRSEHLARHIRKHTGERPFQCHCNRRFSRLDNLRQHAQTVHVNEEIPTDSLAATGTRFQRQIRTDRVRPAGRPRSGTMSSTGTHSRGHSRNLSTSSIGSTSSNFSTSTVDPRRRPPPLLMAGDGRPKLGIDPPSTPPPQFSSFSTHSPADIHTPTSATLSATSGSPAFGSPIVSAARGGHFVGARTPGRRLSVPSATPHVFSSPYPPGFSSYPNHVGSTSTAVSSNNSTITSPTSSTFSLSSSYQGPPGEDWRRRTWHPSTYSGFSMSYNRPATSGLTYSQTPDAPAPAFAPNATAAAGQAPRLPGIESFDHVQQRPTTPPRHNSRGATIDPPRPPTLMPPVEFDPRAHGHRRHISADVLRYGQYSGLGDRGNAERTTASWMNETMDRLQGVGPRPGDRGPDSFRYVMAPPATNTGIPPPPPLQPAADTQHARTANGSGLRLGWSAQANSLRRSPEDSGSSEGIPTPGTSTADVNPTIMPSNGILESHPAGLSQESNHNPCFAPPPPLSTLADSAATPHRDPAHRNQENPHSASGLNRLDALAAVATSENNTTTAHRR